MLIMFYTTACVDTVLHSQFHMCVIIINIYIGSCTAKLIVSRRVCVSVCLSATLMLNILETKPCGSSVLIQYGA